MPFSPPARHTLCIDACLPHRICGRPAGFRPRVKGIEATDKASRPLSVVPLLATRNGSFSPCRVEFLPPLRKRKRSLYSPCRTFLPRRMRLLVDLVWTRPDGTEYVIPAGSITDGPSIPLWLQPFLPDRGETFEAGALHD